MACRATVYVEDRYDMIPVLIGRHPNVGTVLVLTTVTGCQNQTSCCNGSLRLESVISVAITRLIKCP